MWLFHRHKWEIVRVDTIKSIFQLALERGMEFESGGTAMAQSKIVFHYRCTVCSKLRMTVVSNPR